MSTLAWITLASLAGALLSVLCAALFALTAHARWIPHIVSYAVGALLGAAFLEMLPHAFSLGKSPELVASAILAGILLFFTLEKLVLWRHCHTDDCEVHGDDREVHGEQGSASPPHSHARPAPVQDHGRSGLL